MKEDKNNNLPKHHLRRATIDGVKVRHTNYLDIKNQQTRSSYLSRPRSTLTKLFGRYVVSEHFKGRSKRSAQHLLRLRRPGRFIQQHWQVGYFGILVFALAALVSMKIVSNIHNEHRYDLSANVQSLIMQPSQAMTKELTYSTSNQTYTLNKAVFNSSSTSSSDSQEIGSGTTAATTDYGAKIPVNSSSGLSLVDKTTGLSFSITPKFSSSDAKAVGSNGAPLSQASDTSSVAHIIYPISNEPANTVYTIENNGVKEDIVLTSSPNNGSISLSYHLNLPSTLTAKMLPNGSIGVYSANPDLFGNISYGSNNDKSLVQKARDNSAKTNLVFVLPAPVIDQSGNKNVPSNVVAKFSLKGNDLTVTANNLQNLDYPISIDPSITDQSANLQYGGNNEGDISFGSGDNEITTGNLTGGYIGSWTENNSASGTSSCTGGTGVCGYNEPNAGGGGAGAEAVAYNGYLYVAGGVYDDNSKIAPTVSYATISSNGTIGAWTVDSAEPFETNGSTTTGRQGFGFVAYNGYLYIMGGGNNSYTNYNDIQYTAINSNGSIGSWTTNSVTLPDTTHGGVQNFGAVAYDGYMYIVGGEDTIGILTPNGWYNESYYAPINENGSIGSWISGPNLPVAESTTVALYNGNLYVAAACALSFGGTVGCTGATTAVEYTSLNVNPGGGGFGSWQSTSSYTTLADTNSLVASGGYLYIMGGDNGGGTYYSTVQYASINASGTLGAWATTTSFSTARSDAAVTAYNNYLYITAGEIAGASYTYDTQDANVNPAGTLSQAIANTTFNETVQAAEVAVDDGYLYEIGGCHQGGTYDYTCGASSDQVYYASISGNGTLGSWTSTNTPEVSGNPVLIYYGGVTVYNGSITVFGGCDDSDTSYPINDLTGYVGTPCTYTAGNILNTVFYATPNPSTGAIPASGTGAWTQQTTTGDPMPTSKWQVQATVSDGYVYLIGGAYTVTNYNITADGDVEFAKLSNSGGVVHDGITSCPDGTTPETWCNTGTGGGTFTYPVGGRLIASSSANGYIYGFGGTTNSAYYSEVSPTTGDLSYPVASCSGGSDDWCPVGTSPLPGSGANQTGASIIYSKGYMYLISGANSGGGYTSAIYYAAVSTSGVLSAPVSGCAGGNTWWCPTTPLDNSTSAANAQAAGGVAMYGDVIYTVGGTGSGGVVNTVSYMTITNGGSSTLSSWNYTYNSANDAGSFTGGFSNTRAFGSSVAYNGYLYVTGGFNGSYYNDVQYAPINANGTIGTWASANTGSSFTNSRFGLSAIAYDGYFYILGGLNGSTYYNDVQYAPINANGTLGTWQYTYNNVSNSSQGATPTTDGFSNARFSFGATVYDGYMYILGGDAGATYYNDVQYAPINANGTIGTWASANTGSSFTADRANPAVVAYNGYMYVLGGFDGTNYYNDVQYAPINANGTLGTWQYTGSVFANARYGLSAVAYDGTMYIIGGDSSSGYYNDVQYASIDNDGNVETWNSTSDFYNARYGQSVVAYDGYLYMLGGYNGTTFYNDVQYAGLNSIPRVGNYSYQMDLTGSSTNDPSPYAILFTGSDTGNSGLGGTSGNGTGGIQASYSITSNGCTNLVYGPQSQISTGNNAPTNGLGTLEPVANGCSNSYYGRYIEIYINLDDSQTASYPEGSNNDHTTVQSITVYYHPQANKRLRGGATFTNNALQSLDAD